MTMTTNRYRTSLLKCDCCKALGAITWDTVGEAEAPAKLVSISGDFHFETGRTATGNRLIVCTLCDEIHSELPSA